MVTSIEMLSTILEDYYLLLTIGKMVVMVAPILEVTISIDSLMRIGDDCGGVGGGPAEEAACSSKAAQQLALELKQSSSNSSRHSLSCPDLALAHLQQTSKDCFPSSTQKLLDADLTNVESRFFLLYAWCGCKLARPPVSCRTDLALAHLLLRL